MKTQTRALSFTALSVAGAIAVLYFSTFFPTMRLTIVAIAALFTAVTVIEGGLKYGILCFVAVSLLGFFILPDRVGTLLYITFFGAYPLLKSIAERRKSQILAWTIKGLVFLGALALYLTILSELLLGAILIEGWGMPLAIGVLIPVFIVYDIGMSKLIGFYLARIYQHRNGR